MTLKKLLIGTSALLLSSTGSCASLPTPATVPNADLLSKPVLDLDHPIRLELDPASSATSTINSLVSSTSSLSSSISPSPSAASDLLTCAGKDTGSTFTHTTSEGTYDVTCGTDYPGGDSRFLWTDSFDACVAACDEESGCITVAFRSGACYLKSRLTSPITDAGIWAAKKHDAKVEAIDAGPTCVKKASDATIYRSSSGSSFKIVCGREYWGGDLTATSATSFKECIETCSTTSECVDVS